MPRKSTSLALFPALFILCCLAGCAIPRATVGDGVTSFKVLDATFEQIREKLVSRR